MVELFEVVSHFASLSPRLFENNTKAFEYLTSLLNRANIPYKVETYKTRIPKVVEASLVVDGQNISCKATCFVSGSINSNDNIVDTIEYSRSAYKRPNINYNSLCDGISQATHFPVPALSVSKKDIKLIKKAKTINGKIEIKATPVQGRNILVGNLSNPENLIFSHFDSLGSGGALDNASGTAVCLGSVINNPSVLKNNLFVFSSDEELSYDQEVYWGKGYRQFEKKHSNILNESKKIYCVDEVGVSPPHLHQEEIDEFIPLKNIKKFKSKTFAISSSYLSSIKVYHSDLDQPSVLKNKYLNATLKLLNSLL